jgi:FlaA1/EpsC-like NDP-sugar epimerase
MMEAPSTLGRGGDTLVKKNTVLVVGGTGTLGRQVRSCTPWQNS